ncbi:MAG: HEPN domain-containing protein [Candidatus Sumerlaeota bacterium]|nr:HEPN domain-containing protein [Candidatus Sumerlaeota bacterium]
MKPHDAIKKEFTQQWLAKAESDLKAAIHLMSGGEVVFENAVFHFQQATEKYLKAYLVWQQIEFPKAHDILILLQLVASCDQELAFSLSEKS